MADYLRLPNKTCLSKLPKYAYEKLLKKYHQMGATGSLYRIKKTELERILTENSFYHECEEMVDVDKRWEAIMYILSGGFLGAKPFVWLFMPQNTISPDSRKEWDEPYRYHNEEAIKMYNRHFNEISEATILERADAKKISTKTAYTCRETDIEFIINDIKEIKALFKNAEDNGDVILGMIGY